VRKQSLSEAARRAQRERTSPENHTNGVVTLLRCRDVLETIGSLRKPVTTTILDPWYNRGVGGEREDYDEWLAGVIREASSVSEHIFVWGFPEIVCEQLRRLGKDLTLVAWLTWYYKNCPSVIRGWRSAQLTCLHLSKLGAPLYAQHFLNEVQKGKLRDGKLRYMPGPPSVIEVPLNIGFVGRAEQTGHPAQKPLAVIEPLISMTTKPGDTVLDPMCGAGTTGVVCQRLGRDAILCDSSREYARLTERRLGIKQQDSVDYL